MGAASPVQPDPSAVAHADSGQPSTADSNAQPNTDWLSSDTHAELIAASLVAARHRPRTGFVTQSMTSLRGAVPLVRAFLLAGVAIYLILFALPAVFGMAAAATP